MELLLKILITFADIKRYLFRNSHKSMTSNQRWINNFTVLLHSVFLQSVQSPTVSQQFTDTQLNFKAFSALALSNSICTSCLKKKHQKTTQQNE